MKIEANINAIDEIDLGIHMYYGNDDVGDFHAIQIGVIFATVILYRYATN